MHPGRGIMGAPGIATYWVGLLAPYPHLSTLSLDGFVLPGPGESTETVTSLDPGITTHRRTDRVQLRSTSQPFPERLFGLMPFP